MMDNDFFVLKPRVVDSQINVTFTSYLSSNPPFLEKNWNEENKISHSDSHLTIPFSFVFKIKVIIVECPGLIQTLVAVCSQSSLSKMKKKNQKRKFLLYDM